MIPNFYIAYDYPTLETISFGDCTTLDSNEYLSDINAVRILFATADSLSATQESVSVLEAWKQYELLNSVTINGVTYAAGSAVLFSSDHNIGTNKAIWTGYYGQYVSWVPSDYVLKDFAPVQVGLTGDSFPDTAFQCRYDIFTTKYTAGTIPAGTYIVTGTAGDHITIGGATIYVGESFTTSGNTFSGTANVVLYKDTTTEVFYTCKNAYDVWQSYSEKVADATVVTNVERLMSDYLQVNSLWRSLMTTNDSQDSVDVNNVQSILNSFSLYWKKLAQVT